jgi:hypothetical protein
MYARAHPVKIDSIYLAVFCFAQLFLFSDFGSRFFPDFLASYNFFVWAVICAIGFAVYPWPLRRSAHLRLASVIAHLTGIFVISTLLSFIVIGCTASDHFAEWRLGLFFMAVPSAIASFTSLLVSYAVFRFHCNV